MEYRDNTDEELNLRAFWKVLFKRRLVATQVAVAVFVVGASFTILKRPTFRAQATVLVEQDKDSSPFTDLMSFSSPVPVATEIELLKSRTLAEYVVSVLGLDVVTLDRPESSRIQVTRFHAREPLENKTEFLITFQTPATFTVLNADGVQMGTGTVGNKFVDKDISFELYAVNAAAGNEFNVAVLTFEDAVDWLRKNLIVSEVGSETNLIQVSFDSADPITARDVVNKLTEAYVNQNVMRKSLEASQTLDFIETQLEDVRGNLEKGEGDLGRFKSESGIFMLSSQAEGLIGELSKLEVARTELLLEKTQVERLNTNLQSALKESNPYVIGQMTLADPTLVPLVTDFSSRLVELRGMREHLPDGNPRVQLAQAQANESRDKIKAVVSNALGSFRNRENTLARIIQRQEEQLKRLPATEQQLAALVRKSQVNADLYTFLLKKHEESRVAKAAIVSNVRVIDPALPPREPIFPKKGLFLALFFIASLFAGGISAFFLEFWDDSIKGVEDVEHDLGLAIYGLIPKLPLETGEILPLVRDMDPRGPMPEAFRALRTNIEFSTTSAHPKVLVCTSSIPGEGKTTVNVNLASTLARGGYRVLLIDADLRRPQVHARLDLPLEPGLTNLIRDHGTPSQAKALEKEPNFHVLTAGTLPPNPAEFLHSAEFRAFLASAAEQYDYVLVDVPPAVAFTDAAIVSTMVDAIYLVIEVGRSKLPAVRRALASLQNVKAKVQGSIVNKIVMDGHEGAYYYYAGYYTTNAESGPVAKLKKLFQRGPQA